MNGNQADTAVDDRPWSERKCTYQQGMDLKDSPHHHTKRSCKRTELSENILQHVGNTPLVRINKIGKDQGIDCQIYGKCEFLNPGGSIKDRIALRMVEEAEREGRLVPGSVLIEPTSGNTGVGMALVAAVKGYRCIIVLPENMSIDKVNSLKALGAEVVRTKASVPYDSPHSHINVAYRMRDEIENAVILDQYRNPYNTIAHYDITAEEILDECGDRLDMLVMGVGTGGSITGMAKRIKAKFSDCKIIGIDPEGSVIAGNEDPNMKKIKFEVEGIGYDFVPQVFDDELVDKWYKSKDKDTFLMARRLINEEGLLVGGSSGAAMHNALLAIQEFKLGKDDRVVVILPDTIRNYLSKFVSDPWMRERKYLIDEPAKKQLWWWNLDISHLKLKFGSKIYINASSTLAQTADRLYDCKSADLLVREENSNRLIGLINSMKIMELLSNGHKSSTLLNTVSLRLIKYVEKAELTIGFVSQLLEVHDAVVITNTDDHERVTIDDVYAIATRDDLLAFLKDDAKENGISS